MLLPFKVFARPADRIMGQRATKEASYVHFCASANMFPESVEHKLQRQPRALIDARAFLTSCFSVLTLVSHISAIIKLTDPIPSFQEPYKRPVNALCRYRVSFFEQSRFLDNISESDELLLLRCCQLSGHLRFLLWVSFAALLVCVQAVMTDATRHLQRPNTFPVSRYPGSGE